MNNKDQTPDNPANDKKIDDGSNAISPPDTFEFDLSSESSDRLESAGREHRKDWLSLGIKNIVIGVVLLVFIAALLFAGFSCGVFEPSDNPANPIGRLLIIVAAIFGIFIVISYIIMGLITLLTPPPKAQKDPELTIHQYFEAPLLKMRSVAGKICSPHWLKSYVCLLDQAKAHVTDYKGFIDYWNGECYKILEQIKQIFPRFVIDDLPSNLESVDLINDDGNYREYKIIMKFDVISGILNPPFSTPKTVGSVELIEMVKLADIGGHWYLITTQRRSKKGTVTHIF